jgi:hypothetical protein
MPRSSASGSPTHIVLDRGPECPIVDDAKAAGLSLLYYPICVNLCEMLLDTEGEVNQSSAELIRQGGEHQRVFLAGRDELPKPGHWSGLTAELYVIGAR